MRMTYLTRVQCGHLTHAADSPATQDFCMTALSNTIAPRAPEPAPHVCPAATVTATRRGSGTRRTGSNVDVQEVTIPGGPAGETWLRIFRPAGVAEPLPVVVYVHGDDTAIGNARARRPAAKLAVDLGAAVVVVDYSLSPKARVPVAIEETYTATAWVAEHGREHGLDGSRIAVAADAAFGDLAAELMLLADQRGGPSMAAHVAVIPRATAILRAALAA
jgi:acetyl esterase